MLVAAVLLHTGAASSGDIVTRMRTGGGAVGAADLMVEGAHGGGMLRLRGGGQGWYMDEAQRQQKRGRVAASHGEGKHVFDTMMSLEHFPEKLDPLPLTIS